MNLIQIWNHHNRKKCFILILKSCNNHNCLLYSNSLHHYHQKSFQILSFLFLIFLSIHFTIITTGKKWCNWVLYVVQAKKKLWLEIHSFFSLKPFFAFKISMDWFLARCLNANYPLLFIDDDFGRHRRIWWWWWQTKETKSKTNQVFSNFQSRRTHPFSNVNFVYFFFYLVHLVVIVDVIAFKVFFSLFPLKY